MAVASAASVKNNRSYLQALRAQRTLDATNKQYRRENLKCKYFDAIQQQKRQLQKQRGYAVFLAGLNTSNQRKKLLHGLPVDTEWRDHSGGLQHSEGMEWEVTKQRVRDI